MTPELLDRLKKWLDKHFARVVAERNAADGWEAPDFRKAWQGGLTNEELEQWWRLKLPHVEATNRDICVFALGVEVGAGMGEAPKPDTALAASPAVQEAPAALDEFLAAADKAGITHWSQDLTEAVAKRSSELPQEAPAAEHAAEPAPAVQGLTEADIDDALRDVRRNYSPTEDGFAYDYAISRAIEGAVRRLSTAPEQAAQPIFDQLAEMGRNFAEQAAQQADAAPREQPPLHQWGSQATFDVLAERRRQIEAEGWTPEHDDERHYDGALSMAAAEMPEMHALPVHDGRLPWPGTRFGKPAWIADSVRAYVQAYAAAAVAAEREACAALRLDAEQWRALDSHARYWLTIRGKLIDALSREGLTIVSTAQDVHLMRLGKADEKVTAYEQEPHAGYHVEFADEQGPSAATRRAIVRAAAAIGSER